MKRCVLILLVVLTVLILPGAIGQAQVQVEPPEFFVVEGRVIWMSAQKMIVAPPNDLAINVDLARISLSDLRLIRQGDYVIVTGQLLRPTRTVLAVSIRVISPWYPQAP